MEEKFFELSQFVSGLKSRYLDSHINPKEQSPELDGDLDVRAFCLFTHAAIEQYFEEVAEYAVTSLMEQWNSGLPLSRPAVISLMSILVSDGAPKISIEDNESKPQEKPLHSIGKMLRERAKTYSQKVEGNHGASLKYLRSLFVPLGISIDPGPSADSGLRS